jgi:hypothetical protein
MSGSVIEQGKTGMAIERKDTRWKPGQSGNLAGRPLGTRNRFSENFVSDVAAVWQDRGRGILENMAQEEPARFAELCGRLIPKDVSLTISERLPGGLDADDWQLTMEICRRRAKHCQMQASANLEKFCHSYLRLSARTTPRQSSRSARNGNVMATTGLISRLAISANNQ